MLLGKVVVQITFAINKATFLVAPAPHSRFLNHCETCIRIDMCIRIQMDQAQDPTLCFFESRHVLQCSRS